jgi:hypothetical protein
VLNCAQFEILLADYLDGTLAAGAPSSEERDAFLRHPETCAACAILLEDAEAALGFMERAAEADPPPALVGRILHATNGGWELKLRSGGIRGWINRTFAPVLQPRIVMGALLTMMSLTMLTRCGGAQKKTLTAADLDPVRIWTSLDDRTHRIWDRAVKGYESIRLVYEVKTQIDEWQQQQKEDEEAAADASAASRRLATPNNSDRKQP